MIQFKKVRWKNLLSTGNYYTEINLSTNEHTLIVGENGSGKSTMLDALCFGLFGKAFRSINKPQLLNSINQKDCLVEVEFDTNNKSYKIVRGIKPNVFEIYCNSTLLNQEAASKDYQEHLEKFTGKELTPHQKHRCLTIISRWLEIQPVEIKKFLRIYGDSDD